MGNINALGLFQTAPRNVHPAYPVPAAAREADLFDLPAPSAPPEFTLRVAVDRALPARRAPRFICATPGRPLRGAPCRPGRRRQHTKRRWRHHAPCVAVSHDRTSHGRFRLQQPRRTASRKFYMHPGPIRPTPHKRQASAPAPARLAPRSALHDPADVLRSGPSSMPRRWAKALQEKACVAVTLSSCMVAVIPVKCVSRAAVD